MQNDPKPPASEDEQTPPTDSDVRAPATPSDSGKEASPAIDPEVKKLQDRLAQQGRDHANERRRLQSELDEFRGQFGNLTRQLSEERQAEQEARIAQLPPAEQALARVKVLEEENKLLRSIPPARGGSDLDPVTYQQKRSRELIEQANEAFGLRENAVTGSEEDLDWENEATFVGSLRTLARQRQRATGARQSEGEDTVASQTKTKAPVDPEVLRKQIKDEVLQEMGVGGSNAPRPAGAVGTVTSEDIQKTLLSSGPKNRMAMMTRLKEQKEAARSQVTRG